MIEDYLSLRFSFGAHPLEFLRPMLPESLPHNRLAQTFAFISVPALASPANAPGTAAVVIFLRLEDETGTVNMIIWKQIYEAFLRAVIPGHFTRVTGRVQRDGPTTHLITEIVEDVSPLMATLEPPRDRRCLRQSSRLY